MALKKPQKKTESSASAPVFGLHFTAVYY